MVRADTLSERAAALVEADIVSGALAPGARLGIAERAARYGIGATPLREGLSRLVARGLVDAIGQRGFRVKEISREDLADIVRIRSLIECEALRLSMAAGRRRMGGRDRRRAAPPQALCRATPAANSAKAAPEFDALHKGFHAALIAACGSPRMLAAQSDLYDQAYRYRRLMMAKFADPEEFLQRARSDRRSRHRARRREGVRRARRAYRLDPGACLRRGRRESRHDRRRPRP